MKRLVDLFLVLITLPVWGAIMVIVMILVRLRLGSPIFFTQTRPGLHGRPFRLFKFRTMIVARGADSSLLRDADRMTPFGSNLRRTSLDELPELINVLQGQMSLVGPRPLLMKYLPLYSAEQARRNEVKPGITGWAQINGRNAISWEKRFELDVWYVDHRSFVLDLKILCRTLLQVIKRDSISREGHVTMPEFVGRKESEL